MEYAHSLSGLLTNEVQNGVVLSRTYDAFSRPTGYALETGGAGGSPADNGSSVIYSYDNLGRFASVASGTNVFTYTRLPGTDLVTGYSCGPFRRAVTYEPQRDLIATVTNTFGSTLISAFDYTNDAAGRRVSRVDTFDGMTTTNTFVYNVRSEVTSAAMGTNSYGYAYDPIGNREWSTLNGVTNTYAANSLNQYTSLLCAPAPLSYFQYDADGNMTADERGWHYAWNGENRMVCASNAEVVVTYAYDHRGRMVRKDVARTDNSPFPILHYTFAWDDWNIVREMISHDGTETITHNIWGLDLDGILQGLGGVGGLLTVMRNSVMYLSTYDANGNVSEYVANNCQIVAHYEYSPFGAVVVQFGHMSNSFFHRFSTKLWCNVTGINEYLFRKYNQGIGRCLSRDPLLDEVCLQKYLDEKPRLKRFALRNKLFTFPAYIFVFNSPTHYVDIDGRMAAWVGPVIVGGLAITIWALCCENTMMDRITEANAAVNRVAAGWPPGYSTGAEGTPADALQHCIGTCMANQRPGSCPQYLIHAGRARADRGEPNDLANNVVGFNMTGDCTAGCVVALASGQLTCGGTTLTDPTFPCPAPPTKLSSP